MAGDHEVAPSGRISDVFRSLGAVVQYKTQHVEKKCLILVKTVVENDFMVGSVSNLQYTVKRLVRGLGSTHLKTQCSCFGALSTLLKHVKTVDLEVILNAVDNELKTDDDGAVHTGCVLAYGTVIQSGMYERLDDADQQKLLVRLFTDGQAKSYLSNIYMAFIAQLIIMSDNIHIKSMWGALKPKLEVTPGSANVGHVYFTCLVLERYPEIAVKFIVKKFVSLTAFYENTLALVCDPNVNCNQSFVDTFAKCIVQDKDTLVSLWLAQSNKSEGHTTPKDLSVITILAAILNLLTDANCIPELLTPKSIELLIRVMTHSNKKFKESKAKKSESALEKGKSILNQIVVLLSQEETSNSTRLKTIKRLLIYPGNVKFELKTGSKCVQAIIAMLDAKYVKKLSKTFHKIIYNKDKKQVDESGQTDVWNSKERQHVVQMCVKLLNHTKMVEEADWKCHQLQFLFTTAFIKADTLSADFQKSAKENFFKAIEIQMGNLDDLLLLLNSLMVYIDGCLKNGSVSLSEDNKQQWDTVMAAVHKLQKKTGNKSVVALYLLLIYMGLELFRHNKQVATSVADLLSCYKQLKGKSAPGGEEIHWTEVTIDLLLSLLSKDDRVWRHVVSCIFPHVVAAMTDTGLHQIISALDPLSEKNVLSHLDSESDDSEGESSLDDDNEDVKEDDEDEEDDWTDDNDNEEEKVNDRLRMAVRDALGYSAALTDDESVDMDEMKEDEEKRLNEQLANAFRQFRLNSRQGKNAKQSKEDEAQTHFRNRVLGLVDIYVSNSPSMSGCLDLILPLFSLLETAIKDHHQKPFQNRLESVLRKLSEVRKFRDHSHVDMNVLLTTFRAVVHREGTVGLMYVEISPRIAEVCTFLLRCSQVLQPDGQEESPFVEEYKTLMTSYFTASNSHLPVSMFSNVLRMVWMGNWYLVESLYDFLLSDKLRVMRKMKIIELLLVFYSNDRLHTSSGKHAKMLSKAEMDFIDQFVPFIQNYDKTVRDLMSKLTVLVKTAYSSSLKYRKGKSQSSWKQLVHEMLKNSLVLYNKTKSQLVNLARNMNLAVPEIVVKKEKTDDVPMTESLDHVKQNGVSEEQEKVVKKAKKRSKNAALKKESQDLRWAASSQGLESVTFSSISNFRSIKVEEEEEEVKEDEVEVPKGKKRKNVKKVDVKKSKKKKI